jgi:hypothetical protein
MKKNIHLIPTDKPSRLAFLHDDNLHIGTNFKKGLNVNTVNVYITSDEEIKEGDSYLHTSKDINGIEYTTINVCHKPYRKKDDKWYVDGMYSNKCKKIILTTDQDLIKDGVQAIDEVFLKWCVRNSNCEFVNVVEDKILSKKHISSAREGDLVYNRHGDGGIINQLSNDVRVGIGNYIEIGATSDNGWETLNICGYKIYEKSYRIIIPQEYQSECICDVECRGFLNVKCKKQEKAKAEPKHSTIEEAAKKYKDLKLPDDLYDAFIAGAKWQQERMYNVDDMKRAYNACYSPFGFDKFGELEQDFQKWFETFKKK